MVELEFLGTGAAGGTPGRGRSRRRESSLVVRDGERTILVDATRDFAAQSARLAAIDAVLLTHAHRDAAGGIGALDRFAARAGAPIRVLASRRTLAVVATRHRRLPHLRFDAVAPGEARRIGRFVVVAAEVPHATDPRFDTFAWRLSARGLRLVYASDVAHLEARLERFCAGVDLLVIDGAMWRATMPWHLTIDRALPTLCRWRVARILVTQIGRSAPPHARLQRNIVQLCPRAAPAFDGLRVRLGPTVA